MHSKRYTKLTNSGMLANSRQGAVFKKKKVVGLQADLTLSRRVQLAVVAHIRHAHTRYDLLLRETFWQNARRTVEPLCLDILVKWRGDEETGRDQLDEILREIVVIDDSDEDDDDESESEEGEIEEDGSLEVIMEDTLATSNVDGPPEISTTAAPAEIGNAVASRKPSSRHAPSLAKALKGTQPDQPAIAENGTDVQMSESANYPVQTSGIASRTRSKTGPYQPTPRQKTKKARRGR